MIQPQTPREKLFAEICYSQGLEEGIQLGVSMATEILKKTKRRGLKTLEEMEEKEGS